MVTFVWYPANYFLLSFGKQDQLRNLTEQLLNSTSLAVDAKPTIVRAAAIEQITHQSRIGRELLKLGNYVPYRFLRSFVGDELSGLADWKVNDAVVAEAERAFESRPQNTPYRFVGKDAIELSLPWQRYFSRHHEILTGFCLWRLINYLQRNNPNVTNIAGKLFAPEQRDLKLGKRFWNTVLSTKGSLTCIYSGKVMTSKNYSLDHFLPWRFVAHDLLWNLLPTPKDVNSAKSDNLPDSVYFDAFARLQYEGVQAVAASGYSALLEDYILLLRLNETNRLQSLPFNKFQKELHDTIVPQIQIAKNMGFRVNWRYPKT
jgi:hypothetical protein